MFLRWEMSNTFFLRARNELRSAAKWTFILVLPAIALVLLASVLLGGLHGHGGMPLMIAYAPFIALDKVFHVRLAESPLNWFVVAVIEWLYLFILVLAFRMLFLRKVDR